jgi:HPt (histidine-containing phosphotransfer) domain-containing protein
MQPDQMLPRLTPRRVTGVVVDRAPDPVGAADDADLLDAASLARLTELDPSGANKLLERVFRAFQASSARLRLQGDAARRDGDRAALRLVVHTLKSSSASVGALHLSQLCAQIETRIRTEESMPPAADLEAMDGALDATLLAIGRMLEPRA